jgi:hypothetical protein
MAKTDEELIAEYIRQDPHRPGPANVRLRDSWYPVWAVIGDLFTTDGDIGQTAAAYELPAEEMAAAVAYFRRHRAVIEGRLSENAEGRPVRVPLKVPA